LGSNPDISQKYKMSDISTGVANTPYPAKKYRKPKKEREKEREKLSEKACFVKVLK
jgi:hypothetical protein